MKPEAQEREAPYSGARWKRRRGKMEDTQSVLEELLEAFPDLEKCRESIQAAFVLLRD